MTDFINILSEISVKLLHKLRLLLKFKYLQKVIWFVVSQVFFALQTKNNATQ